MPGTAEDDLDINSKLTIKKSIINQKLTIMRIFKKLFESVSDKRDNLQMNKRINLAFSNKRDVWNGRRRFSY